MREMSRFAKWLKTCEITVDGEMYEIRPKLKHLNSLMGVISRSQKKTKNNDGEEEQTMIMSDDDADKMGETFLSIMVTSYPEDDKDALDGFVTQNYVELMQEIMIAFGWAKREDMKNSGEKSNTKN